MKYVWLPAILLLIAWLSWTYAALWGKPPLPSPKARVVESWTGVWMGGTALLRLRQSGTSIEGEYGPGEAFASLTGRVEGNAAVFTVRVKGKLWTFLLTREGPAARLTGHLDVRGLIGRDRPPLIITPHSRAEQARDQENERKQLAKERNEVRQVMDFGVFERVD